MTAHLDVARAVQNREDWEDNECGVDEKRYLSMIHTFPPSTCRVLGENDLRAAMMGSNNDKHVSESNGDSVLVPCIRKQPAAHDWCRTKCPQHSHLTQRTCWPCSCIVRVELYDGTSEQSSQRINDALRSEFTYEYENVARARVVASLATRWLSVT